MDYRIPGIVSLVLLLAAIVIAVYQAFAASTLLGIAFAVLFIVSVLCLLYGYCRKCPHAADNTCRHVFPGWIVSKLFTFQKPSRYTAAELALALLPVGLAVLASQVWLVRNLPLFIAFWALVAVAVIIIHFFVCKECMNVHCAMCPNSGKCKSE